MVATKQETKKAIMRDKTVDYATLGDYTMYRRYFTRIMVTDAPDSDEAKRNYEFEKRRALCWRLR